VCALSGYSTGSGKLEMVDFSYKKEIAWFVWKRPFVTGFSKSCRRRKRSPCTGEGVLGPGRRESVPAGRRVMWKRGFHTAVPSTALGGARSAAIPLGFARVGAVCAASAQSSDSVGQRWRD
jgi:hypothetical protein